MIWSRQRARRINKEASKSAWHLTLNVKRDLAYDLDMRVGTHHVAVGMAEFFGDQLAAGKRPEGGAQDPVKKTTKAIDRREGDEMGRRSGYMRKHWWLGKLTGTAFRAQRLVKPYGGRAGPKPSKPTGIERDQLLNVLLKRGIDFQSVRGQAAKRGAELFGEWLSTTVGETPGLDVRVRVPAGTLDQFGRGR